MQQAPDVVFVGKMEFYYRITGFLPKLNGNMQLLDLLEIQKKNF